MPDNPDSFQNPEAWPYIFELVHVDRMFVDDRYQRPVTPIATRIAENFDRALLEPLLVAPRGTAKKPRYAIADGQNRWVGAKRIGEQWLWCRVMRMTPQEEARTFSRLQSERRGIRPLERFKADIFAEDPEAMAIDGILKRNHITTSEAAGAYASEDDLAAITKVRKVYGQYGEDTLSSVLEVIRAGFPGQRGRYAGEVILALARFMHAEGEKLNLPRLIATLSVELGTTTELLERSAAKRRGSGLGGGSVGYTLLVIEEAYRKVGRGAYRKQWEEAQ